MFRNQNKMLNFIDVIAAQHSAFGPDHRFGMQSISETPPASGARLQKLQQRMSPFLWPSAGDTESPVSLRAIIIPDGLTEGFLKLQQSWNLSSVH